MKNQKELNSEDFEEMLDVISALRERVSILEEFKKTVYGIAGALLIVVITFVVFTFKGITTNEAAIQKNTATFANLPSVNASEKLQRLFIEAQDDIAQNSVNLKLVVTEIKKELDIDDYVKERVYE